MVIGLDSAREQLQWRLIHASKTPHTSLRHLTGCSCQFGQRSVPFVRTQITQTNATANAQSVRAYQQATTVEGESIFTYTGDAGQHTHRRLDSEAARLPHDRRPNRGRWSNLVRQTRTRVADGPPARA